MPIFMLLRIILSINQLDFQIIIRSFQFSLIIVLKRLNFNFRLIFLILTGNIDCIGNLRKIDPLILL